MRPTIPGCRALMLLAALVLPGTAAANGIFSFVDDDGVEHLTNVPDNRRYRLLLGEITGARVVSGRVRRPAPAIPVDQRPYHRHVVEASRATGVETALLHAVISVESGYDMRAVSHKGATGLMQLMPATAARYGIRDILDPQDNIRAGAHYLRDLLAMFDNDIELALAAYNAGEQAVIRHGRQVPPYAETQRYVPSVIAHYRKLSAMLAGN